VGYDLVLPCSFGSRQISTVTSNKAKKKKNWQGKDGIKERHSKNPLERNVVELA